MLVDEHFGAAVARSAKEDGLTPAMPVERSGQDEFDFEFGEEYGAHIEAFDPTFTKVLVRDNPEGDDEMNQRQLQILLCFQPRRVRGRYRSGFAMSTSLGAGA